LWQRRSKGGSPEQLKGKIEMAETTPLTSPRGMQRVLEPFLAAAAGPGAAQAEEDLRQFECDPRAWG
jgi:hypothetical protein